MLKVPAIVVSPSIAPLLAQEGITRPKRFMKRRLVAVCLLAMGLGLLSAIAAVALVQVIDVVTNLAWFARWSIMPAVPDPARLGWAALLIPVAGGLVVGVMARFGSPAIRGHGIPEAMEQVLTNRSRIPPKMVLLKPISAAIAIGTGGPFGAEGPIIATGGALGSCLGQILRITAGERRTLLAAGAAAGMAMIFGTPVAAVLLAVELLLFEFRLRSCLPVALAAAVASTLRPLLLGEGPAFVIQAAVQPAFAQLPSIIAVGIAAGILASGATRIVYLIEGGFERLRLHWMWWPAIGGLVVGISGLFEPRALGIGYQNLPDLADGRLAGLAVVSLLIWKSLAWSIALGSGTSGGTLAPLLTIGGCTGALLAAPMHLPIAVAVLLGAAATFAGASHAVLASAIFIGEATGQPGIAAGALCACAVSWLVASCLAGRSIMVEKIARRGVRLPADHLDPHAADDERIEPAAIRFGRGRKPAISRSRRTAP